MGFLGFFEKPPSKPTYHRGSETYGKNAQQANWSFK
jgi:hypothetical protein